MLFRSRPWGAAFSALLAAVLVCPAMAKAQTNGTSEPPPITAEELNALLDGPTLVTYSGKDVPVFEVCKALLKAIDFPPIAPHNFPEGLASKTISVDWKGIPFWTAAREFETLTGLAWSQSYGDLELKPESSTYDRETSGTLIADTPWIKLAGAQVKHTTETGLMLGSKVDIPLDSKLEAELTLTAYLDPKLKTDHGGLSATNVVIPPDPTMGLQGEERQNGSHESQSRIMAQLEVPLPPGVRSGTVVPSVRGVLRTTVVTQGQTWKLPDVMAAVGAARTVGNTQYKIEAASSQGNRLVLRLSGTKDTPLDPNGKPLPLLPFRAGISEIFQVRDAQGRCLSGDLVSERAYDEDGRRKGTLEILIYAVDHGGNLLPAPYSLEWTLPVATRTLNTPFEIENLKIP